MRLKAAEQIAAWQDIARALAHELKNPLTAMKLSLARLSRTDASSPPDAARISEAVALLQEEVELLMRMTQSFSAFARLPAPRFQPVALRALLAEVCTLYQGTSPVPVELQPGEELTLHADPDGLRRLFGNLLKNATEASAPERRPSASGWNPGPRRSESPSATGARASPPCSKAQPSPEACSAPSPEAAGWACPSPRRSPTSTAARCAWNPRPVAVRWPPWTSHWPLPPHEARTAGMYNLLITAWDVRGSARPSSTPPAGS